MKITQQKRHKKAATIWTIALILLVAVGGYAVYASSNSLWPFTHDEPADTKPTVKTDEDVDNPVKPSGNQLRSTPNPEPKQDEKTGTSTVPMSITTATVNDNTLQERALIEYITSDGSCTITMQGPNGATYTAASEVASLPSSTTCKGFDIPTSKLAPGKWAITMTFTHDTITGTATKEITI